MAKAKATAVKLTGRVGDRVYIDSPKYGYYSREYSVPDPANNSSEFNQSKKRTAMLNLLAGGLNRIVQHYCGSFKSNNFYGTVQKRMRKEPLDNRYLLLRQLRQMEINPYYPFSNLGDCRMVVKGTKSSLIVDMQTSYHPQKGQYNGDKYYYDVILLLWNKKESNNEIVHSRQRTELISLGYDSELPGFEFRFARPAGTVHWLLCLRQQLVVNEKKVESFKGEAMRIVDAGTFDKKDEELLAKREEEEKKEVAMRRNVKREEEEVVVVKAKRRLLRSSQ
jgi:hypothetical protein